jgi:transcriptional regulator of acetoin/glycerol metabolism
MLPAELSVRTKNGKHTTLKTQKALTLDDLEKAHIRKILNDTSGNLTHSARILGICLNTLRRKLKIYNLDKNERFKI